MTVEFRSKGHARLHRAQCQEIIAFLRAAVGKHGHCVGYMKSIGLLYDEIAQANTFIGK